MANWTVATTLERLGQILQEEGLIEKNILDIEEDTTDYDVKLGGVIEVMKDRIVRDQFTPKAKAAHRKKAEAGAKEGA